MKKFLFCLALLVSGCATSNVSLRRFEKVNTDIIAEYSILQYAPDVMPFLDEWYSLADAELVNEINEAWQENIREYKSVVYDCDDFADEYQRFAKNYVLDKYGEENNLAVFKFCYNHELMFPHAINIIYGKEFIYFVEPQSGKIVNLTLEEQRSCFLIID